MDNARGVRVKRQTKHACEVAVSQNLNKMADRWNLNTNEIALEETKLL